MTLVLGACLRLWGMDYGLPQPHARPDEDKVLGPALAIARDGDPHPRQFTYPSLPTYLDTVVVLAARAAGRLRLDASPSEYVKALPLGRGLAVAFGVATIAAAFLLALQAFGSRAVALGAALLTATNPLHALYSRFVTVDVIATFFVTLSLLFAVRAGQGQRRRDYVLAGLCAGLTASCKYNLGIVGLSLVAVAAMGLPACPGTSGCPGSGTWSWPASRPSSPSRSHRPTACCATQPWSASFGPRAASCTQGAGSTPSSCIFGRRCPPASGGPCSSRPAPACSERSGCAGPPTWPCSGSCCRCSWWWLRCEPCFRDTWSPSCRPWRCSPRSLCCVGSPRRGRWRVAAALAMVAPPS